MKTNLSLIHTSPVAIPPLMEYYSREAPEYEITNRLDDGVLRSFAAGDTGAAERSLARMIATARDLYAARLAMVTCSAVSRRMMEQLEAGAGIPVLKIDEPMAQRAVVLGNRVGVMVTFEPTAEPTRRLLLGAAADAGREIDLEFRVAPEAYKALLRGDSATHDRLLLEGVETLDGSGVDCIVLAQVSMAG